MAAVLLADGAASNTAAAVALRPARPRSTALAASVLSAFRAPASGPFRLLVRTTAGVIDVAVAPLRAVSGQPVDPPRSTARELGTAAWITQSVYPAPHSPGTAYIYGHACRAYPCAFNKLVHARLGGTVRITTRAAILVYRIDRIRHYPKAADRLPGWAADIAIPNRVVLVTCTYEKNGESLDNLIVAAQLVRSRGTARYRRPAASRRKRVPGRRPCPDRRGRPAACPRW